jgi:hypothetical protein
VNLAAKPMDEQLAIVRDVSSATDTSPEMEKLMRERLMSRSGAERFLMGVRMFDAARSIVLASMEGDRSSLEFKRRYYQRIYGEAAPF